MKIIADENIPYVKECFSSLGRVELFPGRKITSDTVTDADVLLVRSVTPVDSHLLKDSKVRFVGTATAGTEHIDVEFLRRSGIGFASASGANANSVAEYIVAALLAVAKVHKTKLAGKSIGIIGAGNIGNKVADKCTALEMKVCLNDPPLERETRDMKYRPIEQLYDCDFITLHTPLTFEGIDKTFHLADRTFFNTLKNKCIFLNTSRGRVVDSAALKSAIKSGRLRAVVLDVWENEPNIDIELLQMVDIGTPHIAGYSLDGKVAGTITLYKVMCEYFGLETGFEAGNLLGKPKVPQLKVTLQGKHRENVVCEIIKKIYNICQDDSNLRWICDKTQGKRGAFFDQLRKNYPARREFKNTRIKIEKTDAKLAKKLEGIGFLVDK
ncbi:MAG: 4-phosphoerythronate dehydrogenase [Sedimentisphaerales bacterium]|nr:4-phosphoerythronate dehydrogenase [Sedimentisphaerales bacterium]